jgi:hypothetical protein
VTLLDQARNAMAKWKTGSAEHDAVTDAVAHRIALAETEVYGGSTSFTWNEIHWQFRARYRRLAQAAINALLEER